MASSKREKREIDQRLVMIWKSAPVILMFDDRQEAEGLRHQLYYARRALRVDFPAWERFKIKVSEEIPGQVRLQIKDFGNKLDSILEKAGIGIPEPPELED